MFVLYIWSYTYTNICVRSSRSQSALRAKGLCGRLTRTDFIKGSIFNPLGKVYLCKYLVNK